MKKKSSLREFLLNVYGYSFFNKLMLLSPVYAVFMQNHGMTDMQLSSLFIMLSAGTFLTQVPVTWITNRVGQKNAIMLGQVLKGIGFILWLVWPTYWGFALGMLLWGMMTAFFNVAFEAMVYDELRAAAIMIFMPRFWVFVTMFRRPGLHCRRSARCLCFAGMNGLRLRHWRHWGFRYCLLREFVRGRVPCVTVRVCAKPIL